MTRLSLAEQLEKIKDVAPPVRKETMWTCPHCGLKQSVMLNHWCREDVEAGMK